jgi:hypothetical protein
MTVEKQAATLMLSYLAILGQQMDLAKECSLVVVENVLKQLSLALPYGVDYTNHRDYWELVREQIKKY